MTSASRLAPPKAAAATRAAHDPVPAVVGKAKAYDLVVVGASNPRLWGKGLLGPRTQEISDRVPANVLGAVNPHLMPLVAHDRAGFGGALVSDGIGVVLTSMWGFRAGARWVWWTLLGAGLPARGSTETALVVRPPMFSRSMTSASSTP